MKQDNGQNATFWDHLDELRKVIFRIVAAIFIFGTIAFFHKELLFDLVFAPHRSDFITYRLLCRLGEAVSLPGLCPEAFQVELINTRLASPFLTHLTVSAFAGLLLASPYVVFQLFGFVRPALYENEKKYSTRTVVSAFLLFFCGVLLNYFIIFPLSFRFLGTYQVSPDVINRIDLSSYVSTFTTLSLMIGLVFEIPVVAFFLAKIGVLTPALLKKYRRHAVIAILIVAALITPTADVFTLLLVSLPMYLLYELSIRVVKKAIGRPIEHEPH